MNTQHRADTQSPLVERIKGRLSGAQVSPSLSLTALLDFSKARGLEEWEALKVYPCVGDSARSFCILLIITLFYWVLAKCFTDVTVQFSQQFRCYNIMFEETETQKVSTLAKVIEQRGEETR